MENDDKPVGQILSRRAALRLLGIGSAAFLAACASPEETATLAPTGAATQASATQISPTAGTVLDCVVRPELTIGPYFVDEQLERSDIRANSADNAVKEGVPLTLTSIVAAVQAEVLLLRKRSRKSSLASPARAGVRSILWTRLSQMESNDRSRWTPFRSFE